MPQPERSQSRASDSFSSAARDGGVREAGDRTRGAELPDFARIEGAGAEDILVHGRIEIVGRLPWSSNATFLVTVDLAGTVLGAVYKPEAGERPLRDFPEGLWRREIAAYRLAAGSGLASVPETVERQDAPFGAGSLQRFVDADHAEHYFTLAAEVRHRPVLERICAFDVVANNADRKSGHVLAGRDGRFWGIDNGLCFHVAPKLRTVIWEYAGCAIGDSVREHVERIAAGDGLAGPAGLIDEQETEAVRRRASALLTAGQYPDAPVDGRGYPWPAV